MTDIYLWVFVLLGLPASVVVVSLSSMSVEKLRTTSIISATMMLVVGCLVFFLPHLGSFGVTLVDGAPRPWGRVSLRIDALSAPLVPLSAALWLLTVTVTPRTRLDRRGLPRTALATLVTTVAFLTVSPALLLVAWALSVFLYSTALSAPEHRSARRVARAYLGTATVLFGAGLLLTTLGAGQERGVAQVGHWLIVVAALIRKGIFPFHAWLPEVFDRGRIGPAVLFSAPQMGSYVTAVLILPSADTTTLQVVVALALLTAAHGAALALTQRDARRACGYLFSSQSALVMAGLGCTSSEAIGGSLILWISSALAFAGIARCVLLLEARRGRLDLSERHGGYEQMRLLAASFLVLGLACTGFPGTLGFVGQELLVEGALTVVPLLGLLVVLASALNALAILRMYFSLFCGRRSDAPPLELRQREAVPFAIIASFLVLTGLAPERLVFSRFQAGCSVLEQRGVTRQGRASSQECAPSH